MSAAAERVAQPRGRWSTATFVESELLLIARDTEGLTALQARMLVLMYNDARLREDAQRFIPLDTELYCSLLGVGRRAVHANVQHCAALGWIDLGPRTSRFLTFRLARLAAYRASRDVIPGVHHG